LLVEEVPAVALAQEVVVLEDIETPLVQKLLVQIVLLKLLLKYNYQLITQ
jgi:hypothetical protein